MGYDKRMITKILDYKIKLKCLSLSFALLLSGCSTHTINQDPQPKIQAYDQFSVLSKEVAPEVLQKPWWESFERIALNDLINQSLDQNQEIAQAVAVLNQANALTKQNISERYPQIDLAGNADKNWEGGDGQRGTAEIEGALSWEVDIWNRVRSAAQADQLEAVARREDVEALKLSLSAEVANAYFGVVGAHQRLKLFKEQLKLDRELQELLQLRLDNGVGTNFDVLQQKARVADSETLIPSSEADKEVFENRLDVLLGSMPDAKPRVPEDETLSFTENLPPMSVPSALLLNRPDLRAAQSELVAADAEIASAIADRLPRITLDGSYGFADTARITGPVSMIMGAFVQPLLDWGQRKAKVEENNALYEERLAAYTQLYLEAVEDVENALVRETKQRDFLARLQKQKEILQATVEASEDRYTQGIDDYLPVINALQELRDVERDLVSERLNLINIRIDLFRAIGGPVKAPSSLPLTKDKKDGSS